MYEMPEFAMCARRGDGGSKMLAPRCMYARHGLLWEKNRFEDLGARVAQQIPLWKIPPWESVPALRLECSKRCKNDEELVFVKQLTTEAKLQRWLLSRCKREYT
jgi:hypothetical protein